MSDHTAENDATCPRCGQHRPHGCLCHIPIRKGPCPEAVTLLDALWDLYWNGPGSCDYGDHAGYTWAEDQALTDAAERVEDHYVAHGCRVLPPDGGMPDPASLTPEESARWAEALDGRPRVLPPGSDGGAS